MGDIFLSGQNQCHITGVKKSYFCHTFHLRPKKVFWWVGGGGWKVTLVSVCVHFLKLLDTQTQKWTQSLTKMGHIFLSGQNQCHITGVKKSYFCHTFHLRPKKVFWWVGGGGWKVTLVSVCVHFLKLLDTQTHRHRNGHRAWQQYPFCMSYFLLLYRFGAFYAR